MNNRLPPRWKKCPRKSELIDLELDGKFLAFKTPLDNKYLNQLKPSDYFTPEMLISSQKPNKIGLWFDLTKTNRYYNREIIEKYDIKFVKLQCDGAPTDDQVKTFIRICRQFILKNPLAIIAIHCTHGFNRTGFLICSYLVEQLDWDVKAAISKFINCRPPGIYKQEYINELFKRYDDLEDAIQAPSKPQWCFEDDDIDDDGNQLIDNNQFVNNDDEPETSSTARLLKPKSEFMKGIPGVEFLDDSKESKRLQRKIQEFCHFKLNGFPGSQPVSMGHENKALISQKPYEVSWKADGTRYMMLIEDENQIYLFDRDNSVFKIVDGIPKFPRRKDPNEHIKNTSLDEHIKNTLLDGEMIIDKINGQDIPRYLIYDIVTFQGVDVGASNFRERKECIQKELIETREKAKRCQLINRDQEIFGIRKKDFWNIEVTCKLFSEKFLKNLGHEIDGLIFQPVFDPYTAGQCPNILKWKPHTHNSIDFKVRILRVQDKGCLPETIACLLVGRENKEVARIKATKEFRENDGKIVECTWNYQNQTWRFMRVRTDKSYPNSYATAAAVFDTIKNPFTQQQLLEYIERYRYRDTKGQKRPMH